MRTLCLGEALVDLVCEEPVASLVDARSFTPHCGGAVANAAVTASRCGAHVALAGGVGGDGWGDWLKARLADEGVDLTWFESVPGVTTPAAFVTVNEQRDPDFIVYDSSIPDTMQRLGPKLEEAVAASDCLLFGSNTLVGSSERAITQGAQRLAMAQQKPIVFDANFRLQRWSDPSEAVALGRTTASEAFLTKVNSVEAVALTGSRDPSLAASALVELGSTVAIVTLGAEGAILRGQVSIDVPGVDAEVIDTTGAGDVLVGVLLAALAAADYDPEILTYALPLAVEAAARSVEAWGAVDGLPQVLPTF